MRWIPIWVEMVEPKPRWRYVLTAAFEQLARYGMVYIGELKSSVDVPNRTIEYILKHYREQRRIFTQGREGFGGKWLLYPTPEFQYVINKWFETFRGWKKMGVHK